MSGFYDPKEVRLIINGLDVTGFAEGEKIKIEPVTKEDYKSFVGVDGEVSFSKVNDDRHTITFTLKEESPSNKVLDALRKLPTSFAVMVKNTSAGKFIGGSIGCRFAEKPSITFGAEDPKREWKIIAPSWSGQALPE
ncbi:MAG: DUF3277 domain-containing protein [Spirochaetota bacterium]